MRPKDLQVVGTELAVLWEDGKEDYIPLEKLRRHCPCAGCKGEMDVMGNLYKNPTQPFKAGAFEVRRLEIVGGYAVRVTWADGHSTGLYAYDYLTRIAQAE